MDADNMQEIDNQLIQAESSSQTGNQLAETKKPFSFTRRQLIGIGLIGGLILLFIFGLGVRAGEKRALRKQIVPQIQPTTISSSPSPTTVLTPTPTTTYTSPSDSSSKDRTNEKGAPNSGTACERDVDCLSCFAVPGTPIVNCDAGRCINGVCVWKEKKDRPSQKHE